MLTKLTSTLLCLSLLFLLCLRTSTTQGQVSGKHLSVNFISIGAGTDRKAMDQLSEYMKLFQNENSIILDCRIKPWGKEGEVEYMFDLRKLTSKQQKAFCAHVVEMFKKNKLVTVGGSSSL